MSIFKKILMTVVLVGVTLCNSASTKLDSKVSVDQPFSTDKIIVFMTHEASMKIKTYSSSDFKEVKPDKVVEAEPETYDLICKYLNGESIEDLKIDVDDYKRCLYLEWENSLTKEEILEKIEILKARKDIWFAQPNYFYVLDNSIFESRYDYVSPDIWTNYYYIKVTNKDNSTLHDNERNKISIIEAELLKSYNQIVDVHNEYDEILNNVLVDNKFKFSVPEELFDELNVGYEYIIKLDDYETLYNRKLEENIVLKFEEKYSEFEMMRVINGRLYYTYVEQVQNPETNESYLRMGSINIFNMLFNQFIFKKSFVKNELPFEFELKENWTPVGSTIEVVITDEEKEKMDPNTNYVYYYYKCGVFLFSGDNVLMFDEYIKLAKKVFDTGELYEPDEACSLREQALSYIKNTSNNK